MNILTHKRPEFANIFMDDLFRSYSDVRARSIEGIKGFSNYMSMIEGVDNATNNLALSILRRFIRRPTLNSGTVLKGLRSTMSNPPIRGR